MPWPRRYLSLLVGFFRGFDFGVSSDILFCGALFAISGAEIFGCFVGFGFVWTVPMDSGREKFFGRSIFGSFGAPCYRSGFFVDIRNLDFCLFVRNYF